MEQSPSGMSKTRDPVPKAKPSEDPAATPSPGPAPDYPPRRVVRRIMVGLVLAMLTSMLTNSIIGTALPTIMGELGGQDRLAWVATAALLTMTASTPVWGKLSDLWGRKLLFQIALGVFIVASLAASSKAAAVASSQPRAGRSAVVTSIPATVSGPAHPRHRFFPARPP